MKKENPTTPVSTGPRKIRATTVSSRKAKGRRAVAELRDMILATFSHLSPEDVRAVPTSVTGEDLWLSPVAREAWPFATEVKCKESLSIWSALRQAEQHSQTSGCPPLLAFKRNRSELYVALRAEDFVELVRRRS